MDNFNMSHWDLIGADRITFHFQDDMTMNERSRCMDEYSVGVDKGAQSRSARFTLLYVVARGKCACACTT